MYPWRLIAEAELKGEGGSRLREACRIGEAPQNVIGIIWTYLQEFMGAGCPMAHGDLRRLYLGGGELGGVDFGSSPSILGAQVGVRGPGVSAGVVVSVAYY